MILRETTREDFEQIWPIFLDNATVGDTYAYPRKTTKEQARKIWMDTPRRTYVLEKDGKILGSYYIKTNQPGAGAHVCNCGYMVSSNAKANGLTTAMCEHSQVVARERGYKHMQFNFVASTNEPRNNGMDSSSP